MPCASGHSAVLIECSRRRHCRKPGPPCAGSTAHEVAGAGMSWSCQQSSTGTSPDGLPEVGCVASGLGALPPGSTNATRSQPNRRDGGARLKITEARRWWPVAAGAAPQAEPGSATLRRFITFQHLAKHAVGVVAVVVGALGVLIVLASSSLTHVWMITQAAACSPSVARPSPPDDADQRIKQGDFHAAVRPQELNPSVSPETHSDHVEYQAG
jgi:hypothetical protein